MHDNRDDASPTKVRDPDRERVYFGFLADMGFTKHIGGMASTEELTERCHIDGSKYVLDVGCGVGMTPCHIARTYGCRVVGIDITEGMINRSNETAIREGVQNLVEFRVADARDLPLEDALFDVVISESLVAFLAEKEKAVNELVRVTKPGGYVGLNDSTWVKQPAQKMLDYIPRALGPSLAPLPPEGWKQLLVDAGLKDVTGRAQRVTYGREAINRLRRMGWTEMGRIGYRFFTVALTKPAYRSFMGDALSDPRGVIDYWGYGIYVGRK